MTNRKSYILLSMYDTLRSGKPIRINECMGDYDISIATFRRYIAFLRVYFIENSGQDVEYDSAAGEYRIAE